MIFPATLRSIYLFIYLFLSGILQQLYNWADAFIVGNVEGDLALAAVGGTTTVMNFYPNVITGFTLGLAVLFAQRFGRAAVATVASQITMPVWVSPYASGKYQFCR